MTTIHKFPNSLLIKREEGNYELKIRNTQQKPAFWNIFFGSPILRGIPHSIENEENSATIKMKVKSVNSLAKYLSFSSNLMRYDEVYTLFKDINIFLQALEKEKLAIPTFSFHDFIVIYVDYEKEDREKSGKLFFAMINDENVMEINESNDLQLTYPPLKKSFFSPEIYSVTSIPASIHKNSMIYSFASLCATCLVGNVMLTEEINSMNKEDFKEAHSKNLNRILDTKMYWAFMRCFEKQPQNRVFLLI